MDRLETIDNIQRVGVLTNLHSSMDRLETLHVVVDRDYFTTFTFQYG